MGQKERRKRKSEWDRKREEKERVRGTERKKEDGKTVLVQQKVQRKAEQTGAQRKRRQKRRENRARLPSQGRRAGCQAEGGPCATPAAGCPSGSSPGILGITAGLSRLPEIDAFPLPQLATWVMFVRVLLLWCRFARTFA